MYLLFFAIHIIFFVLPETIPEALRTTCAKCSPKQKELVRIVAKAMEEKVPELWKELVKKQDPNGIYGKDFQAFLKATN